jgi:UDP-2,4-diacetamido-2,4,6-trideoxy-beta-L-altropyranose hydrolase
MKERYAFIYVNAVSKIGSGHFWRCVSIADELSKHNIKILFIYSSLFPALLQTLKQNNYSVYEIEDILPNYFIQIINDENRNNNSLLIIDSDNTFFYEKNFQTKIIDSGIRLMIISVNPDFHYYAHVLLNQNIIACYQKYSVENYTRTLLGPEYFIYTPQFRKLDIQPVKQLGKNIFVSFGSADPCHYTLQLVELILRTKSLSQFNFHVVVGALNEDYLKIKAATELHSQRVQLYYNIADVSIIMLQCNLAICSPGLMYWELALMGVRSILFSSSSREKPIADFLHDKGFAYTFHHYDEVFDEAKFELFQNLILNINDTYFNNFSSLRNKINPEGVTKISDEINNLLCN